MGPRARGEVPAARARGPCSHTGSTRTASRQLRVLVIGVIAELKKDSAEVPRVGTCPQHLGEPDSVRCCLQTRAHSVHGTALKVMSSSTGAVAGPETCWLTQNRESCASHSSRGWKNSIRCPCGCGQTLIRVADSGCVLACRRGWVLCAVSPRRAPIPSRAPHSCDAIPCQTPSLGVTHPVHYRLLLLPQISHRKSESPKMKKLAQGRVARDW